jgi:ring-1,2-phenylacetyl-CoA epoxidase subunit PaaC
MSNGANSSLQQFILAMADDELMIGHRNSEWTGHAPILEEDIAFSNIAQDELGHSLVWYSLYEQLTKKSPDEMAFTRPWHDFTCCHFVTYPKGDFAYTIVRQYLFDEAERLRLISFEQSSNTAIRDIAAKILREEAYHLMHLKGLLMRLGDATEESHRRMQSAVDIAFPQAFGIFEKLEGEEELMQAKVFAGNEVLELQWKNVVIPVITSAGLRAPAQYLPDLGGRKGKHNAHLQSLVDDLQQVYRIAPAAKW